jgi:hypothetical protein
MYVAPLARGADRASVIKQALEQVPQNEDAEEWHLQRCSDLGKIPHYFLNFRGGHIEATLFLAHQPDPRFGVEAFGRERARAGPQLRTYYLIQQHGGNVYSRGSSDQRRSRYVGSSRD